jgi:hypothetical protein
VGSVSTARQFGTISVDWTAVTGAKSYNIYRAVPDYINTGDFIDQLVGYVSTSRTSSWKDANVIVQFVIMPPLHLNPFNGSGNVPGAADYFQQRRVKQSKTPIPRHYDWNSVSGFPQRGPLF